MITLFSKKRDCCGCGACLQACPKGCISFVADSEGFKYPRIDTNRCVECGRCLNVCPISFHGKTRVPLDSVGAWNSDTQERLASSSGGIFIYAAKKVLERNGVVFGAGLVQTLQLRHQGISDAADLLKLCGSKYLQSDTGKTFAETKEYLISRRPVLYCGTPCQIAGLRNFLGREYDGLLTIDFICHGVPSPLVFKKYLETDSDASKTPVNFSWRDKKAGWHGFQSRIDYADGTSAYMVSETDSYFRAFRSLAIRPSCYHCAFRNLRSGSDITIGDFWGVDRLFPEHDDDKGCSVILANSLRGKNWLDENWNCLNAFPVKYTDIRRENPMIGHCVWVPSGRGRFFQELPRTTNFGDLVNRQLPVESWGLKVRKNALRILRKLGLYKY